MALVSAGAGAQGLDLPPVAYPAIAQSANTETGFVRRGWTVVERDRGDLNGDGKADLVLLLRMASKANLVAIPNSKPAETFDTNPFLIVVGFADPAVGFRLAATTHRFYRRPYVPYSGDVPPGGGESMRIERGTLVLGNEYLRGHDAYRFRWNGSTFALIGLESSGASGGCVESLSINYLTRRARWSDRPIAGGKGETVIRRVKPGPVPSLDSFDAESFLPTDGLIGEPPRCEPR